MAAIPVVYGWFARSFARTAVTYDSILRFQCFRSVSVNVQKEKQPKKVSTKRTRARKPKKRKRRKHDKNLESKPIWDKYRVDFKEMRSLFRKEWKEKKEQAERAINTQAYEEKRLEEEAAIKAIEENKMDLENRHLLRQKRIERRIASKKERALLGSSKLKEIKDFLEDKRLEILKREQAEATQHIKMDDLDLVLDKLLEKPTSYEFALSKEGEKIFDDTPSRNSENETL